MRGVVTISKSNVVRLPSALTPEQVEARRISEQVKEAKDMLAATIAARK
jgi:hypothetical protein